MTKNESKLLSLQGIAKASAFCLLLSAFSVNAAMAAPAPAGTVDEVMAVQQGKKVTGVVVISVICLRRSLWEANQRLTLL